VGREKRGAYGFWWENLKERDNVEYLGMNGRIILKWILRNSFGSVWTEPICLRGGTSGGLL
jgi:hypothetical protein